MTVMVPRNKMLAAASKKIRCNLNYLCGSMADAYRTGVEGWLWHCAPVWAIRKASGRLFCLLGKHQWHLEFGFGMVNYSGERCWWCHKFRSTADGEAK